MELQEQPNLFTGATVVHSDAWEKEPDLYPGAENFRQIYYDVSSFRGCNGGLQFDALEAIIASHGYSPKEHLYVRYVIIRADAMLRAHQSKKKPSK